MIYNTWESTSASLAIMAITDPKNPVIDMGVTYPPSYVVYECIYEMWHGIIYKNGLVDNTSGAKRVFWDIRGWSSVTANRRAPKLSHVFKQQWKEMWIYHGYYRYALDMDMGCFAGFSMESWTEKYWCS